MTKRFSSPPRTYVSRRIFTGFVGCLALLAAGCSQSSGNGFTSEDCVSYESTIHLNEGQLVHISVDDIDVDNGTLTDYLVAENIKGELILNAEDDFGDTTEFDTKGISVSGESIRLSPNNSKVSYTEDERSVIIRSQPEDNEALTLHLEQICKSE